MSAFEVISGGPRGSKLALRPTLNVTLRDLQALSTELSGDTVKSEQFLEDPAGYLEQRSIAVGAARIIAEAGPPRDRCNCPALVGIPPDPPCVSPPPLVAPDGMEA